MGGEEEKESRTRKKSFEPERKKALGSTSALVSQCESVTVRSGLALYCLLPRSIAFFFQSREIEAIEKRQQW